MDWHLPQRDRTSPASRPVGDHEHKDVDEHANEVRSMNKTKCHSRVVLSLLHKTKPIFSMGLRMLPR